MMDDEDEDEQEDALALGIERAAGSVPAPGAVPESEGQTEDRADAPERAEAGAELFSAEDERLGMAALPFDGERQAEAGLAEVGHRKNVSAALSALRAGGSQESEAPEPVGPQAAVPAAEAGAGSIESAGAGLEELYRQTAQAVRPAMQGAPAGQTGRTRPAEEPGGTAALTVDELDRAVKRDSRRYDGGMSIF